MRRTTEILGVQGSGAIGEVLGLLPMGLDFMNYQWYNTNANSTTANITQVMEQLNSDITRLYTGADQDRMNVFDRMLPFDATNAPTDGTALIIPNEMMQMVSASGQYATTRNTLSLDPDTGRLISSIRLSITQDQTDTWRLFADVDDATQGGPGAINRILKYDQAAAGGGTGTMSLRYVIPFGTPERRFYRRSFMSLSTGDFLTGDFQIFRDTGNEKIFQRTKLQNDQLAGNYQKRLPDTTSSNFDLDTTETGLTEMFDTMRTTEKVSTDPAVAGRQPSDPLSVKMGPDYVRERPFDIQPNPSAAASLTSLVETYGRL